MSETTNNSNKKYQNFRTEETEIIGSIQQIIFNLNKENIFQSAQSIISIFDYSYPYSFNIVISQFILICIFNANNDFDIYFNFMKEVEKFQEINKVKYKIFNAFANLLLLKPGNQETNYPLFKMFEHNILDIKLSKNKPNPYFVHYMSKEEIKKQHDIFKWVLGNMKELSKNDWELHKQLIEEGLNPNEIAQIIRKDEIEKLQEIASQTEFDFNQLIPKSIYERCSFINQYNVSLIDYAAFFSSVKCFKYLLMNGAKVENTGKYAVAGGNLEIIHLCEQNRSSFQNAYEAAIKFHRNDIFNYLYENKIGNIDNLEELGYLCIMLWNIEIFTLLQKNGLKINDYIINNVARSGNLYLIKHFLKEYPIPRDILIFSPKSGNIELVEYILKQKGIDVNVKDIHLFYSLLI